MSCQLSAISRFSDIVYVKRFFFPSSKQSTPVRDAQVTGNNSNDDTDGWDKDWGFEEQETTTEEESEGPETTVNVESSRKWLQSCIVSLSPANDVLVIAHKDKICVLTQKWDPKNKGEEIDSSLTPVWESSLGVEENETITAVLCVPLASQKRSTQGGPDWTCIIVGFSSGYVRMYTETGVLLLSQLLHLERVEKIKCRTYSPPRFLGLAETHDELLIMHPKVIISIDGFSLIQSLRACRNQVARATASGSENLLQPPSLAYKKWSLPEQDKVNDYISCGMVCAQPFDQLKAASMVGGVKATVRTSPPAMSVYMTTGVGPYIGFFYAMEGLAQPIFSEVAMAMANKIKSALLSAASVVVLVSIPNEELTEGLPDMGRIQVIPPATGVKDGWLGFGGKAKDEKEKPPKIESATPLPLRFGLPDRRRDGDTIILSPCNNYAATTDSFGRVLLIDVQRGTAVRMWKGYRDAQLGWIEVKEENVEPGKTNDHYRMAQFLIIYAPRRGILEIWVSAHGPRVAAFNVSKSCRLICPCYGMMGLNNVTYRGVRSRVFQVALIDPEGVIKTIDVPFHLALSDKSSKRARDLHLLKKLKTVLKESYETADELEEAILHMLSDMKIASIAHQALERILSTRMLPFKIMKSVVDASLKRLKSRSEDTLDLDSRMMLRFCRAQKILLNVYSSMQKLGCSQPETCNLSSLEILTQVLDMPQRDAVSVVNLLTKMRLLTDRPHGEANNSRVTFQEDQEPLPATSFLHAFSYRTILNSEEESSPSVDPSSSSSLSPSSKSLILTISKEATEDRRLAIAKFFFSNCIEGKCPASDVMPLVQQSTLPPDQLLNILLLYWLSSNDRSVSQMNGLYELVKSITALADTSETVVDPNQVSAWWQRVRNMCSQTENVLSGYLAVLVCRAVAVHSLGKEKLKDPDADTASTTSDDAEQPSAADVSFEGHDWEAVTVDLELWDLISKQFEDVIAISTLLNIPPIEDSGSKPRHSISLSMSKLLNGGKGSVSEIVARYVVDQHLNPVSLFNNFYNCDMSKAEDESEVKGKEKSGDSPGMQVKDEGNGEPVESEISLEETIKTMNRGDKIKYQMNELRKRFPHSLNNDILLANCCWEFAVMWNKDPQVTCNLEFSIEYLRLVHNAVLRQGVCSLLWHMFVYKRVSAAASLMEKVGKPPKDRLCRKEVGVSDSGLVTFVSLCVDFMEMLMDANCEAHEVPVCNIETDWQKAQGPTSLIELAVDQKATNYGLLKVHFHLMKIMAAVLTLGMKSVKVLSLFDNKGRLALFKELHSHPLLPNQKVDSELVIRRKSFLCRVIASAVGIMDPPIAECTTPSSADSSPVYKRQRSLHPSSFKWCQVALELGKDFGIDLDYLKRHHVCELYSFGHDRLAEEVMLTVNDQEEMGVRLLEVAGQRVNYEIYGRNLDANFKHLGSMSTSLTRWLQTLDSKQLQYTDFSLDSCVSLLENATSKLLEPSAQHELAQELLEKTKMMISMK